MAVTPTTTVAGEAITPVTGSPDPITGTAGVKSQLPGNAATVSAGAEATGGIGAGNLFASEVDKELFYFKGDDTPLMNLMLGPTTKHVPVASPEVDHYMLDEPRSSFKTASAFAASSGLSGVLPLSANDQSLCAESTTLLVKGVDGYTADGSTATPGKDLMLFVTGKDATSNNPIVRAVNGPKANTTDEYSTIPAIPAGTEIVILSNGLYETQKEVDPDMVLPQPSKVYLQKRGMNQIVSDYFDHQKKQIPFNHAIIAERALNTFKTRCNRSLWAGRGGKFKVNVPKLGMQYIYFSEGLRWQFKRELQHEGKWSVEELIALAKMFFTGEDVPKTAILLAGKNFLENIQCIDYSKHPEVQITTAENPVGWTVTRIHTVFGDIDIKREPTLDRLGWSNSAALLGENRLVHYVYSAEHSFEDRVEGQEATRRGILKWDGLALKGGCHIWIDGDDLSANSGSEVYKLWDSEDAPAGADLVDGQIYYFINSVASIGAKNGEMWLYKDSAWSKYTGTVIAA